MPTVYLQGGLWALVFKMSKIKYKPGFKINRLTLIERGKTYDEKALWRCDCGTIKLS